MKLSKKLLLATILSLSLLGNAQTSKEEIQKIIKEQSDGIYKDGTSVSKATKTVYSDSKDAITTVYEDVKSTTPVIAKAVGDIAKGLKVTADAVWDILVKQQRVWSICYLILTLSALFNWYLFYKNNNKVLSEDETVTRVRDIIGDIPNPKYEDYYGTRREYANDPRAQKTIQGKVGEEQYLIALPTEQVKNYKYLHLIICLGLSGFSAYHFGAMLTGFINPEYGAMKDVLFVAMKLK